MNTPKGMKFSIIWIVYRTVHALSKRMVALMVEEKFILSERYESCQTLVENLVAK